jgi:hypothetical protein
MVVFTDGSKGEKGLGYGYIVLQSGRDQSIAEGKGKLDSRGVVFDAEAVGAWRGLERSLQEATPGTWVDVCLDNTGVNWRLRGISSETSPWAFLAFQRAADAWHGRRIGEEVAQYFLDKADKAPSTPEEILAKLPPEYHEFLKVAMSQDAEALAPHRSFDHKIEVVPGSKLPYSRNRHLSPPELRVLNRWIDDNLAKGWIRPSRSNVGSPMLLAKKPGGGV